MALGSAICKQLQVENEGDIIVEWMVSYLSNLLINIQNCPNKDEKLKLEQMAVETILALWDRRYELPWNADSMEPYKKAADVLTSFSNEASVFEFRNLSADGEQITQLFEQVRKVIYGSLLLDIEQNPKLSEDEEKAIELYVQPEEMSYRRLSMMVLIEGADTQSENTVTANLSEKVIENIDQSIEKLSKLREVIERQA